MQVGIHLSLTVLAALMALQLDHALAVIIDTQASQRKQNPGNIGSHVMTLLAREEVKVVLLQHGINPVEVDARVAAMTDDEITTVANTMKDMPAGGRRVKSTRAYSFRVSDLSKLSYSQSYFGCSLWLGSKFIEQDEQKSKNI